MPEATVYYDYTCRYSFRALGWMDLVADARPDVEVRWGTFSLKEVNRAPEEPSFVEPGGPSSISVLALALAHAARGADFERYHHAVFTAMHVEERKLGDEDLLKIAADAGVDVAAFEAEHDSWIARVGAEHRDAVERLHVYGTPTVVLGGASAYIRLTEAPATSRRAKELFGALDRIASSEANLIEIFRPAGPAPTPIRLEPPPD